MESRSRLLVNFSRLAENFDHLKSFSQSNEIIFMVKANAYGHGIFPIVDFAHRELGVQEFGCASLAEAISLRESFSDCQFEVYVFSDVQLYSIQSREIYRMRRIIPVISNLEDLKIILDDKDCRHLPICLKFNTGMNRLGLDYREGEEIARLLLSKGRKSIYHLMTHFSSASLPMESNKRNIEQKKRFSNLKELFQAKGIELERTSIANSGALEQQVGLEETHIRPGLMLYGPSSLLPQYRRFSKWKGKMISQLETRILRSCLVEQGEPIGYGATPSPYEAAMAILAIGYGDGFSTHYSGGSISHLTQEGKIFGRINMDMTQVLFKDLTLAQNLSAGSSIQVWGESMEKYLEFCQSVQTSPYEVLCGLTDRIERDYITD